MLPCLMRRIGEYCSHPQDLLTRNDLAAFIEGEYGLAHDDAHRLIGWLIDSGYLCVRSHRGYEVNVAAVVDGEILRPGQTFIDAAFISLQLDAAMSAPLPPETP